MAILSTTISEMTTNIALTAIEPSSSGWKLPFRPARTVESRMYVMKAMIGMYMSGEFRSSRGGRKMEAYCCCWPLGPVEDAAIRACCRDHGLCLHGNKTSSSLRKTYELETLK